MIQFYCPDIESNPVLPESDSQHCVRVLRMHEGEEVTVVDGKGSRYLCKLVDAHPKRAMLEILRTENVALTWPQTITIAVAPTKMLDRMEWLVEKLVEIGINRIIPLKCRFSERKELKTERLEKIAVSAMKQSLKAFMPEILPMTEYEEALNLISANQKYIAYCSDLYPRLSLAKTYQPLQDFAILIGPEGDFADFEVKMAVDLGYVPVTLGDNRLRTETAALYACSIAHAIDQRLS